MSLFLVLFSCALQVLGISSQNHNFGHKNTKYALSDFKTLIRTEKQRYVDKTLFIKEVITSPAPHILIMRPPGFGKTLAVSTLEYFLTNRKDYKDIFTGLDIMVDKPDLNLFRDTHMGKHPVIRLEFNHVRGSNFMQVYNIMQDIIGDEFFRHKYAIEGKKILTDMFTTILNKHADEQKFSNSINWLSNWVSSYYNGTKVIVLINGIDTPTYTGTAIDCHERIKVFLNAFLRQTIQQPQILKTIMFGVKPIVAGVVPVNVKTVSIFEDDFAGFFGFSRKEVELLVKRTNSVPEMEQKKLDRIDAMFNGYRFGELTMLNSRAVTEFLFLGRLGNWLDAEGRRVLHIQLLEKGLYPILTIQRLLAGEVVIKPFSKNLDLTNAVTRERLYWTFMLQVGYLTFEKIELRGGNIEVTIRIPNLDAHTEYAMLLEKRPGMPLLKIPNYKDLTENLVAGNFSTALTTINMYLQNAGKLLRNDQYEINTQLLGEYVEQMLGGVALRYGYGEKVEKTWSDQKQMFWFFRLRPNNLAETHIRVMLEEFDATEGTFIKAAEKLKCAFEQKPDKENTQILILYSKYTLKTCLKYDNSQQ